MTKGDPKIRLFRDKFERDLRKVVTIACAVAACTNDGNGDMEEQEMNALTAVVMDIITRAKRSQRRATPTEEGVVTSLKQRSSQTGI
jgi:hypothetical protein